MNIFQKKPFLIAEIGVNYYDIAQKEDISNMDAAKLMIKEAKLAGADAVKFQSYKADTIASKKILHLIGILVKNQPLLNMNYSKNLIALEKRNI